jgi:hypothetical protein
MTLTPIENPSTASIPPLRAEIVLAPETVMALVQEIARVIHRFPQDPASGGAGGAGEIPPDAGGGRPVLPGQPPEREEILSLEWEKNIDLKHGFILLDRTKNGDRREIPINRTLRETLQVLPRRIDTPYVFTDRERNRFQSMHHSFKSACRRVGIKDFRFHDLRHTFASRLLMSGADIVAVKELLGHKSMQMTLRYAHLAPSHKVAAISLLDGDPNQAATQNYTKTIQSVVAGKGRSA